ncbi:oxidoreductase [Flammula alnicola]|nr:oxidoreductase [Flammula alnicola]
MSKVILITGANTGIGFDLARLLAEKNHIVYIGARNEAAGKEALETLQSEGLKTVKLVLLDVTKLPTIQAAKETIEKAEGRLDSLVNNAGIGKLGENQNATSASIPAIRDAFETNLYGVIQTTITFLPLLRKSSNAVILNVSTQLGSNSFQARPGNQFHPVAYATSKAALNSYTIALASELNKEGIKVNVATPGYTATKLNNYGQASQGAQPLRVGSSALLPWVLLDKDGPSGKFFDSKGEETPW